MIVLRELAAEYGYACRHSFIRRVRNIPGVTLTKERVAGKYSGQAVYTVRPEALELIRVAIDCKVAGAPPKEADEGVFYFIQLLPDQLPGRVKVGFSAALGSRLAQHRTTAPEAKLLESWPCQRSWETAALRAFTTQCGAYHVGGEVFDCEDVQHSLKRLGYFFAWLNPQPVG